MDDSVIVRMYWDRNEEALSATAKKYGSYCFSIAKNIIGNNDDAVYTFASTDYVIKNGGSGMGLFLADHPVLNDSFAPDYSALIDFLAAHEDLSAYYQPEGRITVK